MQAFPTKLSGSYVPATNALPPPKPMNESRGSYVPSPTQVQPPSPMKHKKLTKSQFIKNQASSDSFWRRKFMQVLEAMEASELTHARDYWGQFGVSDHEAKVIEREYERQKQWRASKENKTFNN